LAAGQLQMHLLYLAYQDSYYLHFLSSFINIIIRLISAEKIRKFNLVIININLKKFFKIN
jgi:hypothetical protein